jgi:hypothetical protein
MLKYNIPEDHNLNISISLESEGLWVRHWTVIHGILGSVTSYTHVLIYLLSDLNFLCTEVESFGR